VVAEPFDSLHIGERLDGPLVTQLKGWPWQIISHETLQSGISLGVFLADLLEDVNPNPSSKSQGVGDRYPL